MFHTLGMGHEQNRIDRNRHVAILMEHVRGPYRSAFQQDSANKFTTMCVPYSPDSVEHYTSNVSLFSHYIHVLKSYLYLQIFIILNVSQAASKTGQDTIRSNKTLSSLNKVPFTDFLTLNRAYSCIPRK